MEDLQSTRQQILHCEFAFLDLDLSTKSTVFVLGANVIFLINFSACAFVEESATWLCEVTAKGEADLTGWLSCTVEMLMQERMRWKD